MGIFKKANNIYITVRDTYTSISGSSYEEAEEVIIEATNGDLELISQKKVIMQGLGKEDEEQEIEQSEPNNSDNEPNFFIHFRLPKKYDGDFGFDWLRKEYLPTSEGGAGICVSDINALKKEYYSEDVENPFSLRGKDYYCSFLNIFPNKEIKLSLFRENLTESPLNTNDLTLYFDYNKELFKLSSTDIDLKKIPFDGDRSKVEIKLTCSSALDKNTEIKVRVRKTSEQKNKNDLEVGKLMVMKNDVKYKLNAQFVEVEFKGSIEYDTAKDENNTDIKKYQVIQDFDIIDERGEKGKSSYKEDVSSTVNTYLSMNQYIKNWKEYVERDNLFKKLFKQALIEYFPNKNNYKKIIIDFKKFNINNKPIGEMKIDRIKKSISSITALDIECNLYEFLKGLKECYESVFSNKEKGIIVFLLPINVRVTKSLIQQNNLPFNIKDTVFDAFADEITSKGKYIMLTKFHQDLIKSTLVHEAGHTLGLTHTFPEPMEEGIIPKHLFSKNDTENIMDYPKKENLNKYIETFFKWQWKIMQKDSDLISQRQ